MNKATKYTITKKKKEEIIITISSLLQRHSEIYAAYLFGSFVTGVSFADIDVGVLLRRELEDLLEYETELESNLEKLIDSIARFLEWDLETGISKK